METHLTCIFIPPVEFPESFINKYSNPYTLGNCNVSNFTGEPRFEDDPCVEGDWIPSDS